MNDRTTLYRILDRHDRLLYIGQTQNILRRLTEHAETQPWWPDVVTVNTLAFSTRYEAMEAEQHLIRTEGPSHNILHNPALSNVPTALLKLELEEVAEAAHLRWLDLDATPGFSPSPGAEWVSWRYPAEIEDGKLESETSELYRLMRETLQRVEMRERAAAGLKVCPLGCYSCSNTVAV